MKAYVKPLSTLLIAGTISICSFAQSSNSSANSSGSDKKLFFGFGYSPLLSVANGPVTNYIDYGPVYGTYGGGGGGQPVSVAASYFNYDLVAFVFDVRYNLTEFNNNSSLSAAAIPDIGLGISGGAAGEFANALGILSFNLPLMVEYNIGNVSTYTADKDKGFVIGAGFEVTAAPLVPIVHVSYTDVNNNTQTMAPASVWAEPCFELGYRHWNKSNKAKEINLKFGVGANGAFTARLSWIKYIGY
jgi:hypothetical protein